MKEEKLKEILQRIGAFEQALQVTILKLENIERQAHRMHFATKDVLQELKRETRSMLPGG